MNYAALVTRINKAIDKAAASADHIGIHFITIDNPVEELHGLVIVLHPESTATPKSPV